MKLGEAIGMVAVGAIAMFGVTQFLFTDAAPEEATGIGASVPVVDVTPTEIATTDDVAADTPAPLADDVQVSRMASNLDTFAILEQVISSHQNEDAAAGDDVVKLTPEQEQVIEMFRATARRQNENKGAAGDGSLVLNNMAVVGLNVRYYYTVMLPHAALTPEQVMERQQSKVIGAVCGSPEIKILMEDYGFDYTYSYLSEDRRLIGTIDADLETCTG
ncbi:MAG: hypothetical protein ABJO29_07950 [Yoonia sp.]|uniref:hypothetical protein n=1 Tax=Yoonia sp. TaxID=2212373 RepID=UPI0032664CA9